jgi:hypothetical protein
MKKSVLIVGVAAFAFPIIANASEIGLRVGLETPLYSHQNLNGQSTTFSIGDSFQPAVNVLVEYYPIGMIGLGLEAREGFLATGTISNCVGLNCGYTRTGTSFGPNLTLDLAPIPVYFRAAIPIHVEPDPVRLDFRAAGGVKLGLSVLSLYLELLGDFPLAGSGVSAFKTQQLGLGAGVWLTF